MAAFHAAVQQSIDRFKVALGRSRIAPRGTKQAFQFEPRFLRPVPLHCLQLGQRPGAGWGTVFRLSFAERNEEAGQEDHRRSDPSIDIWELGKEPRAD